MNLRDIVLQDLQVLPARWVRGGTLQMVQRPRHGFVVVSKGKYIYHQNGREIVSDPEHLIYLPQGASYGLRCVEDDLSYVIHFRAPLAETQLCNYTVENGAELVWRVQQIMGSNDPLRRFSIMYDLLSVVASGQQSGQYAGRLIRDGVQYLQAHYQDPELRIDDAAVCAGLSTVYFRKLFSEVYGISPIRFVRQLRMEKASRLLCELELSVEQIALVCGYKSVYSFSAAFRKQTGFSPTGFVREHHKI